MSLFTINGLVPSWVRRNNFRIQQHRRDAYKLFSSTINPESDISGEFLVQFLPFKSCSMSYIVRRFIILLRRSVVYTVVGSGDRKAALSKTPKLNTAFDLQPPKV